MPSVAAFVRGWFNEPPPTFELRQASARWGQVEAAHGAAHAARRRSDPGNAVDAHVRARAAPATARRPSPTARASTSPDRRRRRRDAPPLLLVLELAARRRPAGDHRQAHGRRASCRGTSTTTSGRATRWSSIEPTGNFTLETDPSSARDVVLVAGGVGITPLMSIAETVLRAEPGSRVVLLCGNRSEDEIIFAQRLDAAGRRVRAASRRFGTRSTLRREGWTGLRGALDGALVLQALEGRPADAYYVCGPEPMMQQRLRGLDGAGRGERPDPHRALRLRLGGDDAHPGPRGRDHVRAAAAGASPPRPARRSCRPGSTQGSTCRRAARWAAAAPARCRRPQARSS